MARPVRIFTPLAPRHSGRALAADMKTHGIKSADGREFAFEVANFHLGRNGLCRLVARIPGCVVVRKPSRFRWSFEDEPEFCEFELDGVRFVASDLLIRRTIFNGCGR